MTMEPVDDQSRAAAGPDPAAVDLSRHDAVSIDIGQLLSAGAGAQTALDLNGFEHPADLRAEPRLEPVLSLVSRTIESTMGILELPHLRILILLSQKDAVSVAELASLMKLNTHRLSVLLDSMEASGWIDSGSRARGIGETIAIRGQGRDLVDALTERRQREIDEILTRVPEEARAELARAFNSFAAAAGESPTTKPRKGIAPRNP
jgi:DNA-binding MarR family transcriptional regulator